jgi:hypothetical protein
MRFRILLALGLLPALASAQQGTYVVRQNGVEIGRERLTSRAGTERSADGSTLEVESQYRDGGVSALLQRAANGDIVLFRLRTRDALPATILGATSGGRLTLRREERGAESAREVPARPGTLLLDEQAWTLLQATVDLATGRGTSLTLVFPRSSRTYRVLALRDGRTVTISGELLATLQLDAAGRFTRADVPGQSLSIVRQAD